MSVLASHLVAQLQGLIAEHGDRPVWLLDSETRGLEPVASPLWTIGQAKALNYTIFDTDEDQHDFLIIGADTVG